MSLSKHIKKNGLILACLILLLGCNYSNHTPPATPGATTGGENTGAGDGQNCDDTNANPDLVIFEEVNQAVFQTSCAGCHSGQFPAAGIDLSNFEGARAAADQIEFQVVNGMMPPPSRPALNQDQKDLVSAWVQDGAVDEIGAVLCEEMMEE